MHEVKVEPTVLESKGSPAAVKCKVEMTQPSIAINGTQVTAPSKSTSIKKEVQHQVKEELKQTVAKLENPPLTGKRSAMTPHFEQSVISQAEKRPCNGNATSAFGSLQYV
jgi:hypothetical protein